MHTSGRLLLQVWWCPVGPELVFEQVAAPMYVYTFDLYFRWLLQSLISVQWKEDFVNRSGQIIWNSSRKDNHWTINCYRKYSSQHVSNLLSGSDLIVCFGKLLVSIREHGNVDSDSIRGNKFLTHSNMASQAGSRSMKWMYIRIERESLQFATANLISRSVAQCSISAVFLLFILRRQTVSYQYAPWSGKNP